MHDDDRPIGRVLTRREAVRLLAIGGAVAAGSWRATMLAQLGGAPDAAAAPACVVRPEMTEGPFFVDRQLERSDVRVDPSTGRTSAGLPLALAFTLTQVSNGACTPLPGAVVDIWQCDADGVYSGVSGPGQPDQAAGSQALRGFQTTDAAGRATFTTIYPGWYRGRAVHIHFKIRTSSAPSGYEFTSQLFFDDALSDRVYAQAPYNRRPGRDTLNRTDGIFGSAGSQMVLAPVSGGEGMAAAFAIGLDLSDAAAGRPDGGGGGGRGRGRGRGFTGRATGSAVPA
jgi:protocatechuate 3,4-dioxygenase beta subunit